MKKNLRNLWNLCDLNPSRDLDKFAASLSKALASFAPASPTAKEPFRDAFGIQISNFKYNQFSNS
jgi:hypothetical protein